jgi:hypothetical protein
MTTIETTGDWRALIIGAARAQGATLGLILAGMPAQPDGDAAALIREAGDAFVVGATQQLIDYRAGR